MSAAGSAPLPAPVDAFVAVVNRHDQQGFLDAFTDDAFVDDWGRVFTGREEIAGWSEREFIGSHGVLTPTEVTETGGVVTVVGDWRSTHANGLSSFAFVTRGDRIVSMTIREG